MTLNQALIKFQAGIYSTQHLKAIETNRRALNMQLSTQQDVEHNFTGFVNSLDLEANDHRYLLSGCSDGSIRIHDLFSTSGVFQHTHPSQHTYARCICDVLPESRYSHNSSVECVQWYPSDNRIFATSGGDRKLKIWDTNEMKPVETFTSTGRIHNHSCSWGYRALIAVGSHLNNVELVDLRTGFASHLLRGHKGCVMAVSWSPRDSCLLTSSSTDGQVFMWDVRSAAGPILKLDNGTGVTHKGIVHGLAFTPDGLHLLTLGSDRRMRIWDTSRGKLLPIDYGSIKNYSMRNIQMAVGPQLVFVPSNGKVRLLCLMTGETAGHLTGHFDRVNCCVYREAYQELYSGGNDRNVLVWAYAPVSAPSSDGPAVDSVVDNWSSDEGA